MARWVTAVRLASSVWLQPNTALPALISAANCTRSDISRSVHGTCLRRFDIGTARPKKNPGGLSRRGAYCSSSTAISRLRQEVFVDTEADRPVVHVLNGPGDEVRNRRAPDVHSLSTSNRAVSYDSIGLVNRGAVQLLVEHVNAH